jgi:hypothetical protein
MIKYKFINFIVFKIQSINFLWIGRILICIVFILIVITCFILNFIMSMCSFTENAHSNDQNIANIN